MAAPFTEKEKKIIKEALLEAGNHYASTVGMRKTTVDQLAQYAGISKGAFYKFYSTKELLFFEVLEGWHTLIYDAVRVYLEENKSMKPKDLLKGAILLACENMEKTSMMRFFDEDLNYILRKIPNEILKDHYHSDAVHVRELIKYSGLVFSMPIEKASASINLLIGTLALRNEMGDLFDDAFMVMVDAISEKLTQEPSE